jgi:hypothetical protein
VVYHNPAFNRIWLIPQTETLVGWRPFEVFALSACQLNNLTDFNHGIEGLIFLYISVNRHNLLDDSMEKLGKVKQNLKSPLKIEFIGE